MTDSERAHQIAQLTHKRDKLLDAAPQMVLFQHTVILCFLGFMILLL